jgi:hypothetical protein
MQQTTKPELIIESASITSNHSSNGHIYFHTPNRRPLVVTNPSLSAASTITGEPAIQHLPYLSRQPARHHTSSPTGATPTSSTPTSPSPSPPPPTHQTKHIRRQCITPLYHAPPATWSNPPTFPRRTSGDEWPMNGNPVTQLEAGRGSEGAKVKAWYRRCWIISLFVAFVVMAAVAIAAAMVVKRMAALVGERSEEILAR